MTDKPEEKIIRRIQGLLAQADHPNTDPTEANTFRAKAEALMWKYRIDEATAAEKPDAPSVLPQWDDLFVCGTESEFRAYYAQMFGAVAAHVGVRYTYKFQDGTYVAQTVGYPADLAIVEGLYTSCMLAFQGRVEPKYDPELSEQVNAYIMRSAGMEGWRIAQAIYGRDDKSLRPKVRAMFKKEAEARGEDPTPLLGRGSNMKAYRINYAHAFVGTISTRLRNMREARGEFESGLVLASRQVNIDEAYYEKFPYMRPQPEGTKALAGEGDVRANCAKCQKAKSGYCREHNYMKPRAYRGGGVAYNYAAQARGREAANAANIGAGPSGGRITAAKKELGS